MNRYSGLDDLEKETHIIRCPVCGQEYLPAELFMPSDFLGEPTEIVKRRDGVIDFYFGERPTFETEYCCDSCSSYFKVKAKVSFEATAEDDFSKEYSTKLKTNLFKSEVDLFNAEDQPTTE